MGSRNDKMATWHTSFLKSRKQAKSCDNSGETEEVVVANYKQLEGLYFAV